MYVGDYSKNFLSFFLKITKVRRKYKKLDSLGMGISGSWIVDIRKLVGKIPQYYYFQDQETYFMVLIDIILIVILEEIIHSEAGVYHDKFDFNAHFYYKLIKTEEELKEIEETDIFRYISFMNSLINLRKYRNKKYVSRIKGEIDNINNILNNSSIFERENLAQILKRLGIQDL